MLLNIHDKNLKIIGILDNESQDTICYGEDKWTRDLETGSSVYEFTAFNRELSYETVYTNPFNCLNVGNYISFNYGGEDHIFKIMSVEKTGTETYCYCENLNLELRNEMVGAYDSGKDALTIEEHISKMNLLNATNMAIGLNELSNVGKVVSFTNEETKFSRLLALFKAFGAEHKFTTKLQANGNVKELRVDIYKKRDSDGTGGVGRFVKDKILQKGENIKSLKEKQDILEIFNMTVPKGVKKVTRVTQEKKPTVNSNEVVVSSNMVNASGTLSIENIQTILKLCYEYRLLPSGVISQLYLESFWGNSNVARVDNNWSGMTWTGNPNRPSGVVVSQGSARPSAEGGYYMHFANMSDFFKDYFFLLAKQGIYNVANKNNISDYTRGLFRVGGAQYDYAAAGFDHYNNLMNDIRKGINSKNGNVLDTYDSDWKNPKVVTSTTVERAGAPNTKRALEELSGLVGRTVGNGQCYAVAAWLSYKLGGAGLGAGLGSFSGLIGSGIRACDIGTDYNWGSFGWGVEGSGFSGANIVAGTILNIKPNHGSPWYTGYYGHTVVVESVNGDTVTILQQNYAGKQYVTRDKYSLSAIVPSIQTLVHPPELAKGGRVDGGNAVVKVDGVDRYVNVDLPTNVKTTEETEEFYIPDSYNNKWYDENGNLEFYISGSAIRAPQSADNFPVAFSSKDNGDKWIRRDFEYEVDSVEELIEKSLEDLKNSCYPTLDYEIDGFFEASIGDTYIIEDDDFEPKLTVKARVISQEISHTQPENNKTTLSNYIKLKSAVPDDLTSRLQQLIDASIPYEIKVSASNGTSFKNNEGESELTVELLKSGITQEAEFFFKNGDSIVGKGTKLLVKATDFENVLNLTVEAYVNNNIVATHSITFTDIADGSNGSDGVGVKSTEVTYTSSTSGTTKPTSGWGTDIPSVPAGSFLWTKTVWTYTDDTSKTSYSVSKMGETGEAGKTTYPHWAYADNSTGTVGFSLTDGSNKQYQGYYSDYYQTASTDPTKYTWVDRTANVQIGTVNLLKGTGSPFVMGYGITNTTWDGDKKWAYLDLTDPNVDTVKAPEILPQGQFNNFKPTKGMTYTQSILIATDATFKPNEQMQFSWFTNGLHNTQKTYVKKVGEHTYQAWSTCTWNSENTELRAFDLFGLHKVFGFRYSGTYLAFYKPKLTTGNLPSDWSAAPEDVQSDIDSKADEEFTLNQLNALKEAQSLAEKELEAKALQSDFENLYQEYLDYVNLDNEQKEKSEQELITLANRITSVINDLNDTKERWNFLNTYMEAGEEGLAIGQKDGSAQIKLSDDRISMFSNGEEVMYITQSILHIENGIFTKTLQIGNFRFESLDNGEIFTLRYLGGY